MNEITKTKLERILLEMKEANSKGETELFSKVYVQFNGESRELIEYFDSFNIYVNSMFGPNHDLDGGYLYINWQLSDSEEWNL